MVLPSGRLSGKLFLLFCKILRRYHSIRQHLAPSEIAFFQQELKRQRTANAIMKQYIRKKRLRPLFLTKRRIILFAFMFGIPHRRIPLSLPISKSTIHRYISMVKAKAGLQFSSIERESRARMPRLFSRMLPH